MVIPNPMDASEDPMDRKPNNPKLGFMYASKGRKSKEEEDVMDGIPNNPKLGFVYAPEAGLMDRIARPRSDAPDFIGEAMAKAAKGRASAVEYEEEEEDAYWCNLEKILQLADVGLDGGRWGRRRGKGCVVGSFSGLDIEMERAAAERRRRRKNKPIFAQGFA